MKTRRALQRRPLWYLEDIAPLKNKVWTEFERLQIFHMRVEQGLGIDDILRHFQNKITRVMLYNQIRLTRKIQACRCYRCGAVIPKNKRHPGLMTCNDCKKLTSEYKKLMREEYLSQKICGVCWKRKAIPGHTACRQCISLVQRRRNKKGFCCKCGKNPIEKKRSITLCSDCLDTNQRNAKSYRAIPHKKQRTWKWT